MRPAYGGFHRSPLNRTHYLLLTRTTNLLLTLTENNSMLACRIKNGYIYPMARITSPLFAIASLSSGLILPGLLLRPAR